MKPQLYSAPSGDGEAREEWAESVLKEIAARDHAYVAERLRHVVEQLAAEGVFEGMTEVQVRAVVRDAVADLGVSPERGSN